MSDHVSATAPNAPTRSTNRAFSTFAGALLAAGVLSAIAVGWWLPEDPAEPRLLWTGPLLVIGFLLAEQLAINVDVRSGVAWTISFTEIPLVLGLLVAPFEVVLAAHVVAGVGTLLGRRVLDRAVYNAGLMFMEISVAFAAAEAVKRLIGDVGPVWAGAFVGTIAVPLLASVLGLTALRLMGKGMRVAPSVRLVLQTLVVALLNTSAGLAGYEIASRGLWGMVLIALVFAGITAIYLAYSGLLREQRDLEALSEVSLRVARSGRHATGPRGPAPDSADGRAEDDDDEWQLIAERIREQLNANRVVLRLRTDPQAPMRTLVAGEPLPSSLRRDEQRLPREDAMLQLPGTQVRYFRAAEAGEEVAEALVRRDAQEALVVPLRGATQLLGAVEVHDRLSRWRGFGRADIQLLGTLASHLSTAVDNRRLLARLRHDAYHDPLTGLLNRTGFREAAAEPLRESDTAAVVRVDLDVLSTVLDALGQAWGNRMVVAAGRRLRDELGPEVPLARLEGGAFAALLVDRQAERIREIAERLRASLSVPYPVDRLTVEAGAVVGWASTTDVEAEDPDADALLQGADVAVRATNENEPLRAYAPSMGQIFLRRFQLVTQFRSALESGQISVHYQPKVALPSKQVIGAESLVRWKHPEFGRVDPDEFVPAVEATGLVDVLTDFVMDKALERVRRWIDRGLRMSIAVNLSVRTLADEEFPDRVAAALARHDVPPELLTFELTESGVMADPERALPVLRRLHQMGVVLAVDDFGTGYSSLAYLRQLPVDEVKIDKSFVLGMGTDLGDMAVVRSIVELGHSLGLTVVAEGVEDDAARDQLVGMGCDVAQGYLISRPLSEDRFEAWLHARTVQVRGARDETVLTLVH
ncbi:putative bifunctional diguanylate cyclase/phosphodiesterase [Saccharothrix coeruleofusca]|uniref:Bifunctional diguanylate cyclase/phosphodiesterase n=1 Tax=Saccharothrix coeruleofusca TaxID=33919 RepID=A0A918EDJ2_9PSEU|nr:EAL domain-containing protein [Saccharothrix coeruleofusca]MBP2339437.1 diguanylate cyclase (GGDEF)-like protein [Saccharothrix coeruleofusca]GGP57678.1 bifunctional diguanylate cyclase/phosphodiesterase [Saccharothrix coeruleofusca]